MKRWIVIFGVLVFTSMRKLFAQQWAIDEAYDNWRDTSSDSFSISDFIGITVLIGVIWLIAKGIIFATKEHARKMERQRKNEEKTGDIVSNIDKIIASKNHNKE